MKALEPKFPFDDSELEDTEKEMGGKETPTTETETPKAEPEMSEEMPADEDPTEALREFYAMLDPQDKEILKQIVMSDNDGTMSEDMETDNSVGKV